MSISFKCAQCGKKLKAPSSAAGKKSTCPDCGAKVTCPVPNDKVAPVAVRSVKSSSDSDIVDLEPYVDLNPYADLGSDDPYSVVEPLPERPAVPVAPVAKPKKKKKGAKSKKAELKDIAIAQKGVLLCILLQIGLTIAAYGVSPDLRRTLLICQIAASLISMVFVLLLAIKLYGLAIGLLMVFLSGVPCIGLIVLLSMNSKATRTLQDAGLEVGLLGASLSQF